MSDPTPKNRQQLAAELAELTMQQHEAMKFASLFRMTDEEARAYDKRHERIKELCGVLGVSANAA
jgi:hypothetical protein